MALITSSLLALALVPGDRIVATVMPGCMADSVLSLEINIPAYELTVRMDGQVLGRYPVAVGMRRYRTPTGQFRVSSVAFNPWWIPPRSEWAKHDTVTPPGPRNPLGRVKLQFGPMLLLHGTPVPASVGRAASHGCVRMHNEHVVPLAKLVLAHAGPPMSPSEIDEMAADEVHSPAVVLEVPVPFAIRYSRVEWRDDTLFAYPDPYRRGSVTIQQALRVLAEAGIDTTRVRRGVLRTALARSAARRRAVPADSLLEVVVP